MKIINIPGKSILIDSMPCENLGTQNFDFDTNLLDSPERDSILIRDMKPMGFTDNDLNQLFSIFSEYGW